MSIKDLFKNSRFLPAKTNQELERDIESRELIDETVKNRNKFVPQIEYNDPKNFAFYGLAEDYYENSIARIYNDYPYDGSLKEKKQWHNQNTQLDNYIFEYEYPRTVGHYQFMSGGFNALGDITTYGNSFILDFNSEEYIIKGDADISIKNNKLYVNGKLVSESNSKES